jgi:hypothetical protein
MATTLQSSVFVYAPVETVESVLYDGWRYSEWVVGITQAQPDDVYPNPGGVAYLTYTVLGINFDVTMTSVEVYPGQSATTQIDGAIQGMNYWQLQPEGEGTWVTCTFEYTMPGGGLGQAIDKMMFEKRNAENLEQGLNNLKALAEG